MQNGEQRLAQCCGPHRPKLTDARRQGRSSPPATGAVHRTHGLRVCRSLPRPETAPRPFPRASPGLKADPGGSALGRDANRLRGITQSGLWPRSQDPPLCSMPRRTISTANSGPWCSMATTGTPCHLVPGERTTPDDKEQAGHSGCRTQAQAHSSSQTR